jgi:hypothetical protein
MIAKIALHQVWDVLPKVHDISVELPRQWTDQLLREFCEATDWLKTPNTYSFHSNELFGELPAACLATVQNRQGVLRHQA